MSTLEETKIVLIGEAPGPRTDPRAPLFPMPKNSAGYKLYELTGLKSRHEYLTTFDRMNLFAAHPGTWDDQKRPKDKWSQRDARIAAESVRYLLQFRRVVFVGRRVAQAFGYGPDKLPFFEWQGCGTWRFRFACIPHTSGRNHFYNDPANREAGRKFFEALLRPGLSPAPESAMMESGQSEKEHR